MSGSNRSNNQTTWQERPFLRLSFAVVLLVLLNVILFSGGMSINEVVWPTMMIVTFLALGEFALRVNKKSSKSTAAEKNKHNPKKRRLQDFFGLLAMLALGILFMWIK